MKRLIIAAAALGFCATPALASELEEYCVSVTTESDGDPSGCSCLAEAADDDMTAELLQVETDEDIEALSDASKEAIAACWPDAA